MEPTDSISCRVATSLSAKSSGPAEQNAKLFCVRSAGEADLLNLQNWVPLFSRLLREVGILKPGKEIAQEIQRQLPNQFPQPHCDI